MIPKVRLFLSYAPQDEAILQKLESHLSLLARQGLIEIWHQRRVLPGQEIQHQLNFQVQNADVILLLVSADFLASNACYEVEMQHAMQRHEAGQARVVPIIVRPVEWEKAPFGRLQPLPQGGKPITTWDAVDSAYADVARGIRSLTEQRLGRIEGHSSESTKIERQFVPVVRVALEQRLARILSVNRRLLLLAPRRGGARTLARRLVEGWRSGSHVTWLNPPTISACTEEEFFAYLTDDQEVHSALDYYSWQRRQATQNRHLIALLHDGGPQQHMERLAAVLRSLLEEDNQRFCVLLAGGGRSAALRYDAPNTSLFAGMPTEHVPDLSIPEIARLLTTFGEPADLATPLYEATGGYPGFIQEVMTSDEPLTRALITTRLRVSPQVQARLRWRLADDDRLGVKQRHASHVLRGLLGGRSPHRLGSVRDDLRYAEVRLYYDGLLREGADGGTEFRCEAVRHAAEEALAVWEGAC